MSLALLCTRTTPVVTKYLRRLRAAGYAMGAVFSLFVLGCADEPFAPEGPTQAQLKSATEREFAPPAADDLSNMYVVVFRDDVLDPRRAAEELTRIHGGEIHYIYRHVLKGFGATLPPESARAIERSPIVHHITPAKKVVAVGTQTNAPWGLDRIDQRDLPLSGTYTYTQTGAGVRAYIVDTGILTAHTEFGGRASVGYDAFGQDGQDCDGHGTHVAGITGAATYGVAKGVSLVSVRVLDCNGEGTTLGLIAGIDWVQYNHVKPAVANLSIVLVRSDGTETSDPDVDNAVASLINAGVSAVIAAGNTGVDACNVSPARTAAAITTAASNSSDYRWVGTYNASNTGSCVDIFAPGQQILSTYIGSNTATATLTGTSMAAPHVAGVVATYLERNPGTTPSAMRGEIMSTATTNRLQNIGAGSPNVLVMSQHPISVYIDGPFHVNTEGTYTWEAIASGGNGTFTYRWEALWTNTGTREALGTERTQSLYLTAESGDVELNVWVKSGDIEEVASHMVCNLIPPNDAACA